MTWYREWFGEDYLDLYAHRDRDEAEHQVGFVVERLPAPVPAPVLDLACGAGRHSDALTARGHVAVGIDLSLTLLAHRAGSRRACGDMRRLPFRLASFGWVLNFFTSFGYFESERENFLVLQEVARVLAPGGWFLLDLLNPEPAIRGLKPRESKVVSGREVELERWYDPATQRINKRIRVGRAGEPARSYLESVRAYRLDEARNGLGWAGFELEAAYGAFDGETYSADSERMILLARKT